MKVLNVKVGHDCANVGTLGAHTDEFESNDTDVIELISRSFNVSDCYEHRWIYSEEERASLSAIIGKPVRRGSYIWLSA